MHEFGGSLRSMVVDNLYKRIQYLHQDAFWNGAFVLVGNSDHQLNIMELMEQEIYFYHFI